MDLIRKPSILRPLLGALLVVVVFAAGVFVGEYRASMSDEETRAELRAAQLEAATTAEAMMQLQAAQGETFVATVP